MATMVGMYLCFVGYVIALGRMFFPLKTKQDWEKINAVKTVPNQQRIARIRRVSQAVVNESRQLA